MDTVRHGQNLKFFTLESENLLKKHSFRGYLMYDLKAVCRTCKVIDACLKCALDTNQDYGVWGGLSEDERRALKRRAMRARRSQAMQLQV